MRISTTPTPTPTPTTTRVMYKCIILEYVRKRDTATLLKTRSDETFFSAKWFPQFHKRLHQNFKN